MSQKTGRIKELDALRGIAALMVVFFHFSMEKALPFGLGYLSLGSSGVDLFFIISGFVIFMSLDHVTKSSQFIINRFSRLYPTYWAVVTFTFLLITLTAFYQHPGSAKIDLKLYLGNMTMFQYYLGLPDIDGPYWTMIVEMLFYLVLLLLFRFKLLKRVNIIGVTAAVLMAGITGLASSRQIAASVVTWVPLLAYTPLFTSGILFYKIYTGKEKPTINYTLILLLLVCQVIMYPLLRVKDFISQAEYAGMLSLYFAAFTLFVNHKLGFIVSKITLFFGKISYALYLVHQYIAVYFIVPGLMSAFHFRFLTASLTAFIMVIVLAALITQYIEIPMRKAIKRKLAPQTAGT